MRLKNPLQYVGRLNFCSKLPLNKKSSRFWFVSCQSVDSKSSKKELIAPVIIFFLATVIKTSLMCILRKTSDKTVVFLGMDKLGNSPGLPSD